MLQVETKCVGGALRIFGRAMQSGEEPLGIVQVSSDRQRSTVMYRNLQNLT